MLVSSSQMVPASVRRHPETCWRSLTIWTSRSAASLSNRNIPSRMNRLRSSQLLRMNEHVQEYVCRIYEANGVPSEQATDDASPRTRAEPNCTDREVVVKLRGSTGSRHLAGSLAD